jgi:hypothetical protein
VGGFTHPNTRPSTGTCLRSELDPTSAASRQTSRSDVACRLLRELYARAQTKPGVHVSEVRLNSAR